MANLTFNPLVADVLLRAIHYRWRVRFEYRNRLRDAAPHVLAQTDNRLYLLAWEYKARSGWRWRMYRLENIERVFVSDQPWILGNGYVRPEKTFEIVHLAV